MRKLSLREAIVCWARTAGHWWRLNFIPLLAPKLCAITLSALCSAYCVHLVGTHSVPFFPCNVGVEHDVGYCYNLK